MKFILIIILFISPIAFAQYPPRVNYDDILEGAVDIHIHSAPDIFNRSINDIELASIAEKRGFKAIVIKNHVSSTAGRAELLNSQFDKIKIFGGITLNKAVGGINPAAVQAMVSMSPVYGKFVWFPTFDAGNHISKGEQKGISILKGRELTEETVDVLNIILKENLIIATGHISPEEIKMLTSTAVKMGVKKIVITHALIDTPNLSLIEIEELAKMGAYIELTYLSYISGPQSQLKFLQKAQHVPVAKMAEAIKKIGARHFIISSDLGQSGNPIPPDGMVQFVTLLMENGISRDEIKTMIQDNPAKLLDLQ